jgi:uncharacterized LabA/DUF88 family protein
MLGDLTYLFIDGGYLREVYRDQFEPIFGDSCEIDYRAVMASFGAQRAYLYDCLDNQKRPSESDIDFETRIERQEALFDEIDKVEGMHVRYGVLSPRKGKKDRRQQKEVDVLLAVDMLEHSFSKVMREAILLSGDLDFRPVVESAVRLGTFVRVVCASKSGHRELCKAADFEAEIDLPMLCSWVKLDKYEERWKRFPGSHTQQCDYDPYENHPKCRRGVIGPQRLPVSLVLANTTPSVSWQVCIRIHPREVKFVSFHDQAKLLDFVRALHGEIDWDPSTGTV